MNYKKLTIILIIIDILLITSLYYLGLYICGDSEEMTTDYCINHIIKNEYYYNIIFTTLMYTARIIGIGILVAIYKGIRGRFRKH